MTIRNDWRSKLAEVLEGINGAGHELADCEAPVREQYAIACEAYRVATTRISTCDDEPDGYLTDCGDCVEQTASWLAGDLGDEILAAVAGVDEQLDKARELAEYVVELVDALEGDPELGLGENDHHARRIARDLLRDLPPGAPISVAP